MKPFGVDAAPLTTMAWLDLDRESKIRPLKPLNRPDYEARKTRRVAVEENAALQQRKPPIKNVPRTAGVAGGEDRKGSTADKPQKKARWQGTPSPKRRGTHALIQGRSQAEHLPRTTGMVGGKMRKLKIPGMEGDTTYSPARRRSISPKK